MQVQKMNCASFLMCVLAFAAVANRCIAETAITPKEGVVKLFNGKDLTGLTTWLADTKHEDPRNVFSVKGGVLHISGDGLDCVRTNDAYRDYQLIIEYRWGERTWGERKENARDSGVLIHAVGPDGNSYGAWMASIEILVIEGGTGGFIAVAGHEVNGRPVASRLTAEVQDRGGPYPVWKKGGKTMTIPPGHIDWLGKDPNWQDRRDVRGPADVENPVGRWNRMEIIADGDRIVVQLNGITVNEAFACFPNEGKIAIQTELAEIDVRRWELRPLNKGDIQSEQ